MITRYVSVTPSIKKILGFSETGDIVDEVTFELTVGNLMVHICSNNHEDDVFTFMEPPTQRELKSACLRWHRYSRRWIYPSRLM